MIAEGLFTQDEIDAAKLHGAEVVSTKGRISLKFPNQNVYDKWVAQQRELHPDKWSQAVRVPVKDR